MIIINNINQNEMVKHKKKSKGANDDPDYDHGRALGFADDSVEEERDHSEEAAEYVEENAKKPVPRRRYKPKKPEVIARQLENRKVKNRLRSRRFRLKKMFGMTEAQKEYHIKANARFQLI